MNVLQTVCLLLLPQLILQVAAECPMIKCLSVCKPGVGPDGCNICDCPKTCEDTKCEEDQVCVMNTVVCKKEPCDPYPSCVPKGSIKCTTAVCESPCVPDIGPDGCEKSVCACPPTCKDTKCEKNEVCELVEVQCFRAPCFPQPQCFPKNKTCSESPNVKPCKGKKTSTTRWTYNSKAGTCERFQYYGCTPSPNTFNSKKQCNDRCTSSVNTCKEVDCMVNCYRSRKDTKSCPECVCPCQTVKCSAGHECQLNTSCGSPPCNPVSPCVPVA